MLLDPRTCDRARLARDARFDGRFFTGVHTTGVYCRPICPVKPARTENVRFFPTAAAAERAGFRPCLRCRPETAPGTPPVGGAAAMVQRALELVNRGFLDEHGTVELAAKLGMGPRHPSVTAIQGTAGSNARCGRANAAGTARQEAPR